MKIAIIGSRGIPETYSGVEVFLKEVCPRLVEKGHDVTVFCMSKYFSVDNYCGVKLVKVPCVQGKYLETMTHSFLSIICAITDGFDIIHFQNIGPASLSFIPRLAGIKTIMTQHSLNWKHSKWNGFSKQLIRLLEGYAVRTTNCVATVAIEHQRYLQKQYHKPIHYIPNGVTINPPCQPNHLLSWGLSPHQYLLYVGRLSPEKGCHYLIQAFNRLKTNFKLVIAGGASNESQYANQLKKMADTNVMFLGHVSGEFINELYSNAQLYIIPSDSEGLSISLLEAMSYGCCVLASSIKENQDVISDCGVLFEHGNVEMLLEKMHHLLNNHGLRQELGLKAKAHITKSYNWDDISCNYEKMYQDISFSASNGCSGPGYSPEAGVRAALSG